MDPWLATHPGAATVITYGITSCRLW